MWGCGRVIEHDFGLMPRAKHHRMVEVEDNLKVASLAWSPDYLIADHVVSILSTWTLIHN